MFVTVFYGVFDPQTGMLTYANAGHNPPRTVMGHQVQTLGEGHPVDLALGILPGTAYASYRQTLSAGELLLLYTDGVTEAFNPSDEAYSEGRLDTLLARTGALSPEDLLESLLQDVTLHAAGASQSDDITMAALKWQPAKAS